MGMGLRLVNLSNLNGVLGTKGGKDPENNMFIVPLKYALVWRTRVALGSNLVDFGLTSS
jgi:hypothetical protein